MKRLIIRYLFRGFLFFLLFLLGCNLWVIGSTHASIYDRLESLSQTEFVIVLGTSRLTTSGDKNPFFEARMDQAASLYSAGKVDSILVSGDNDTRYYNEPRDMSNALMERGVPAGLIKLDAGGLRTFDSFYRYSNVFQKKQAIIVTQRFHAYRAVYIASNFGIQTQVYIAESPQRAGYLVYLREWIARPLALWDLHIANRKPKYTD